MAPNKVNVKERVTDGEIDLSMSELHDVPVKEIAVFKRVYSLDLSNNELKSLPINFATLLTHLTKLDLSKNQLTELPENFGDLVKLRYLDLYQNRLEHLPLSFSKLKALRWLDLKDNSLVPAVAKVAGLCLEPKECEKCARDVVTFFSQIQDQVNSELEVRNKQRQQEQLEANQQKQQENAKKAIKKKEKKKQRKNEGIDTQAQNAFYKDRIFTPLENNKKKKQFNNENSKKEPKGGFPFLKFSFALIVSVFISTSIDCKYTQNIKLGAVQFYNRSVSQLPPNLQTYAIVGGNYVKLLHENTGNVTTNVINYVRNNEHYISLRSTVITVGNNTFIKAKELGNYIENNENYMHLKSLLITFGNSTIIKVRELYRLYAT